MSINQYKNDYKNRQSLVNLQSFTLKISKFKACNETILNAVKK